MEVLYLWYIINVLGASKDSYTPKSNTGTVETVKELLAKLQGEHRLLEDQVFQMNKTMEGNCEQLSSNDTLLKDIQVRMHHCFPKHFIFVNWFRLSKSRHKKISLLEEAERRQKEYTYFLIDTDDWSSIDNGICGLFLSSFRFFNWLKGCDFHLQYLYFFSQG